MLFQTTALRYNITGLTPLQEYEVRVCSTGGCGACQLCFQTAVGQGSPPPTHFDVDIRI